MSKWKLVKWSIVANVFLIIALLILMFTVPTFSRYSFYVILAFIAIDGLLFSLYWKSDGRRNKK